MFFRPRFLLLLLSLSIGAPAAFAQSSCPTSLGSLNGWYGLLVSGSTVANATPKYLTGALLFDGAGHISANHIYAGTAASSTASGTYQVNTDCSLTIALTVGSATQNYTVGVTSASEAVGIETDSTAVATIDLQAQFSTPSAGLNFTNSSLNGTDALSCIGPQSASSDLNLVTFSNGSLSGTDPYNNGGGFATANVPYTGTYSVNTDGTFAGSLVVLSTNFDFYGVISKSGSEVEYIYSNVANGAPTAAFAACSGGTAQAPVATGTVTQVNLASVDNIDAVATLGSATAGGGFDGSGYAYAASLLGTSATFGGNAFTFGTAAAPSAVAQKTVTLPAGSYSVLQLLGAAAFGPVNNAVFTVNYTDGTTSTFTQSLSDWGAPKSFGGESTVVTMASRVEPSGAAQAGPWNVYGYTFTLNAAKTVQSITLPNSRDVIVMAIDLTGTAATLTSQTITFPTISAQKVGANVALTATASSGLAVSYASTTTPVCTVSGSTATIVAAGTCSLTASQSGNSVYAAASPVSQSFAVAASTPGSFTLAAHSSIVTVTPPVCFFSFCFGAVPGSDAITVTPSGGFSGPVSFTVSGVPAGITGTFSPSTITGSGTTTLTLNPTTSQFFGSAAVAVTGTSGTGASAITAKTTFTLNY